MNITKVAPPQTVSGRRLRLSEGEMTTLASIVRGGEWASDGEPVRTKTAAYQRAQSAVKALGKRHQLHAVKTSVCLVDEGDENSGYLWSVGPRLTKSAGPRPPSPKVSNSPRLQGSDPGPDLIEELGLEEVIEEEC